MTRARNHLTPQLANAMRRRHRAPSRRIAPVVVALAAACVGTTHALTTDVDFDPRYVVHVLHSPTDSSPITKHRVIDMTAANGASYKCVVPDGSDDSDEGAAVLAAALADALDEDEDLTGRAERESAAASRRDVDELLSPLRGRCFFHANGDWWTYEFCHEKHVEQFHREGTTRVNAYDLGRYDARATAELDVESGSNASKNDVVSVASADEIDDASEDKYHAHAFTHGTKCGDVGAQFDDVERSSEVRFVCSEDGAEGVASVDEPATCKYVFTFRTPLACKSRMLRPKQPDVEAIVCSRVDVASTDDQAETEAETEATDARVEDARRGARDEL